MKLFYFSFRGKGEMIRLLFHVAGVPFEDVRISPEDWPKWKPEFMMGQVPVLELDDGTRYCQSVAILSYLAREFGYYAESNLDRACIDQILELILDYWRLFVAAFYCDDPEKKGHLMDEMQNKHTPYLLQNFEKLLTGSKSGFFVGDKVTAADIAVFSVIEDLDLRPYPRVKELKKRTEEIPKLAEYLKTRPVTPY